LKVRFIPGIQNPAGKGKEEFSVRQIRIVFLVVVRNGQVA
jgi:hypothetical protein